VPFTLHRIIKHTVSQLSNTNKARHILIEDLKSTTIFLRLAGLTETTWAVKDFEERVEVDCNNKN
jgi:hypothetical protein